jgi:methionyl-tRNA formyltransferase
MTNTSAKIIFFGTEEFSLAALTGLIEAGYNIAAVVTKPDSKKGRGQQLTPPSVKVLAIRHNIPVWQPIKLTDIADDIQTMGQVTGILVSYGKIIPQSIIDLFTPGIINVHPSLLPKYRGPSPIESAIMNGDKTTGVTIMQLSAQMDAGPIYSARQYPLVGSETQPHLYIALATFGVKLLLETLPSVLDRSLRPTLQDDSKAVYCQLLKKSDAHLDLNVMTASQAERAIRAHLDYPKSKLTLLKHECTILKAHVSPIQKNHLDIKCQDGMYLCIDELIAPSGRKMSVSAFIRGYTPSNL